MVIVLFLLTGLGAVRLLCNQQQEWKRLVCINKQLEFLLCLKLAIFCIVSPFFEVKWPLSYYLTKKRWWYRYLTYPLHRTLIWILGTESRYKWSESFHSDAKKNRSKAFNIPRKNHTRRASYCSCYDFPALRQWYLGIWVDLGIFFSTNSWQKYQ